MHDWVEKLVLRRHLIEREVKLLKVREDLSLLRKLLVILRQFSTVELNKLVS